MSDQQYYRILLDDYSAASFTSFDKAYFGTMSDLEGWIKAIEVEKCFAERFSSLTKTFRAYQSGQHNITHNVAYQEVRFLDMLPTITMVRPLHPKRSTTGMPTEEMMV